MAYNPDATFPMPFAALEFRVQLKRHNLFVACLAFLAKSPTSHRYAVDTPTYEIYCTEQTAQALQGAFDLKDNQIKGYNRSGYIKNELGKLNSVKAQP